MRNQHEPILFPLPCPSLRRSGKESHLQRTAAMISQAGGSFQQLLKTSSCFSSCPVQTKLKNILYNFTFLTWLNNTGNKTEDFCLCANYVSRTSFLKGSLQIHLKSHPSQILSTAYEILSKHICICFSTN